MSVTTGRERDGLIWQQGATANGSATAGGADGVGPEASFIHSSPKVVVMVEARRRSSRSSRASPTGKRHSRHMESGSLWHSEEAV